jgi:hypothetical protein
MLLIPNDRWKPRLAREIRNRDLFLLFWSARAKRSEWVTWEWRTALRSKGEESMQIHPLESQVKPPKALQHIHFGDPLMDIRARYSKD